MRIHFSDDFNLAKIAESGQCFRVRRMDDNSYRFITGQKVLYICQMSACDYQVSCSAPTWQRIWAPYFDLTRSYQGVRRSIDPEDRFLTAASAEGTGIRILKQDPWETLVSFIISQRKSIPAIQRAIEALCRAFGCAVSTPHETIYAFPSAKALYRAEADELRACGLGYRTDYVKDAAKQVAEGRLSLTDIAFYSDEALLAALQTVYGVGIKVAGCTALFGYGRTALAPVDTWISRIMVQYYGNENPFLRYGSSAGILQQYAFHYALHHKHELG